MVEKITAAVSYEEELIVLLNDFKEHFTIEHLDKESFFSWSYGKTTFSKMKAFIQKYEEAKKNLVALKEMSYLYDAFEQPMVTAAQKMLEAFEKDVKAYPHYRKNKNAFDKRQMKLFQLFEETKTFEKMPYEVLRWFYEMSKASLHRQKEMLTKSKQHHHEEIEAGKDFEKNKPAEDAIDTLLHKLNFLIEKAGYE